MANIVVVGSSNVDIAGYTPRFPMAGETLLGNDYKLSSGGKGNNQATAAARAGAKVTIVTAVGDDFLSGILLEHYRREGMCTDFVRKIAGVPTGMAMIQISAEDAQNKIIVVKGANAALSREDVYAAAEQVAGCDMVIAQLETGEDAVYAAKALAKAQGKPFLLNPAPYVPLAADFLRGIDYFTPNETEAAACTGIPVESPEQVHKAAELLLQKGIKNVLITLGKRGAYFYNGREEYLVSPPAVQAIDTTGAGDAFNGGFAVALAEGKDTLTAMRFASCVASLSITQKGAAEAMPTRDEAEKLMQKFYGVAL